MEVKIKEIKGKREREEKKREIRIWLESQILYQKIDFKVSFSNTWILLLLRQPVTTCIC